MLESEQLIRFRFMLKSVEWILLNDIICFIGCTLLFDLYFLCINTYFSTKFLWKKGKKSTKLYLLIIHRILVKIILALTISISWKNALSMWNSSLTFISFIEKKMKSFKKILSYSHIKFVNSAIFCHNSLTELTKKYEKLKFFIYCNGTLLDHVQRSKIFNDCKHFVDLPLRYNPGSYFLRPFLFFLI